MMCSFCSGEVRANITSGCLSSQSRRASSIAPQLIAGDNSHGVARDDPYHSANRYRRGLVIAGDHYHLDPGLNASAATAPGASWRGGSKSPARPMKM